MTTEAPSTEIVPVPWGVRLIMGCASLAQRKVCHRVMCVFFLLFFRTGPLILVSLVTIARLAACQFRTSRTKPTVSVLNSWGQTQDTVTLMKLPNMGAVGHYVTRKHNGCFGPPQPHTPNHIHLIVKAFMCTSGLVKEIVSLN